jgi:2-polyprenyl-3-methyl-5-hydroxy-6-metoxy-1,4-benzoquinol methylase
MRTQHDLVHWVDGNADYADLRTVVERVSGKRVLDVGVGSGITSAYLAALGSRVTCVEPSAEICAAMEPFFERLELEISIVCGTGESIDQIGEEFDSVVFWSSLHHCDDPFTALKHASAVLRPGGLVFLFEPVLRFYRSKKWFYRMLETQPGKVGHYGGNEHIYRYHEYVEMLRAAAFTVVAAQPSRKYAMRPKRASWDTGARWLMKRAYYRGVRSVAVTASPVTRLLLRASILTPLLAGQKPGAGDR